MDEDDYPVIEGGPRPAASTALPEDEQNKMEAVMVAPILIERYFEAEKKLHLKHAQKQVDNFMETKDWKETPVVIITPQMIVKSMGYDLDSFLRLVRKYEGFSPGIFGDLLIKLLIAEADQQTSREVLKAKKGGAKPAAKKQTAKTAPAKKKATGKR